MRNLKSIIKEAQASAISGSKLIAAIRNDQTAKEDFEVYLDCLCTVLSYEGKRSNCESVKANFTALEPSQFVKFLAINLKEGAKIDGNSLLTAVKTVMSVKELKHLS